ncbi:hypothetical protein [Streptomyces celluloflavus]|uniref:hypothetical protein n=1 Tax=Streptomyces celluloflavus TaxID=58344 RepID=UPI0036BE1640
MQVTAPPLPAHDPPALYVPLTGAAGRRPAFLLEGLAGPRADRRPAVVGHGRLTGVRLFARHIEVDGAATLRPAPGTAAEPCDLARAEGPGTGADEGRDRFGCTRSAQV